MMKKEDIKLMLSRCLREENNLYDLPSRSDWVRLEKLFNTEFSDEFIWLMELMVRFQFPGELLNVNISGFTNGNDDIETIYKYESRNGEWPHNMIPFLSIGNGDYFCLNSNEGKKSRVYYIYHEDGHVQDYMTIEEWIISLPEYLA